MLHNRIWFDYEGEMVNRIASQSFFTLLGAYLIHEKIRLEFMVDPAHNGAYTCISIDKRAQSLSL